MGATPTTSVATRPDLSAAFMEFDLEASWLGFIGLNVFPVFDAAEQAASFRRVKIASLLAERDTARASGAPYPRSNWEFEEDNYATREHGIEEAIDDRDRRIYRNFFDMELIAARRTRDAVLRNLERRIAAKVFDAATWTGAAYTTSVTTEWSTKATSVPISDVNAAKLKVFENSGLRANAVILNYKVYLNLTENAQIIDKIKYWGGDDPKNITPQILAKAFDVDMVLVAGAQRNSAKEGQAATLSAIWDQEYAMVCRVAQSNDLEGEPCIGRTIHWSQDGSSIGGTFESYRKEENRSDIVRCRLETAEKMLFKDAGHLLANITA